MISITIDALPQPLNQRLSGPISRKAYWAIRKRYDEAKTHLALLARVQMRRIGAQMITGPVEVWVTWHYSPTHRRDNDAGVKALFDALIGVVWEDDRLIKEHHVREDPRRVRGQARTTVKARQMIEWGSHGQAEDKSVR